MADLNRARESKLCEAPCGPERIEIDFRVLPNYVPQTPEQSCLGLLASNCGGEIIGV